MDSNILKNISNNNVAIVSIKKPIPSLVERGLVKQIAKINDIDVNTEIQMNRPSEFQLLLYEIKDSTLRCIRNNWLFFILLLIIIIYLYRRYHEVKRKKRALKSKHQDYLN